MSALGWVAFAVALGAFAWWARRARWHDELVARACHELRTPLTAARLAAYSGGPDALALVELELRRAGLALDDLAAARGGGRADDVAEVLEAHEVVEAVLASWLPVARGLDADLGVEPVPAGLFLEGDRLRLGQALGNLVGNALEHGAGPVLVRVRVGADWLRFEVDDAGPGLPAPVAVLAARPRAGRGRRGRGLAIASDIAARHGGRVSAAPAPEGARLVLELPLLADARDFEVEEALAEAPWSTCDEWPPVPPGRDRGCIPAETGVRPPALANRPPWWRRPS
jgi:signal transduction histidine kinase